MVWTDALVTFWGMEELNLFVELEAKENISQSNKKKSNISIITSNIPLPEDKIHIAIQIVIGLNMARWW